MRKVPPCSHWVSRSSSKDCGKLAAEPDSDASGPFDGELLRLEESLALVYTINEIKIAKMKKEITIRHTHGGNNFIIQGWPNKIVSAGIHICSSKYTMRF